MKCIENEQVVAMRPIKLTSTDNAVSANMIIGLLEEKAIPCYAKDLESGNYMSIYMGYSVYGKEIYVDEEDYEKAKRLLEVMKEEQSEQEEVIEIPRYKTRGFVARVMIVIFGAPVLAAMIFQLFFA